MIFWPSLLINTNVILNYLLYNDNLYKDKNSKLIKIALLIYKIIF